MVFDVSVALTWILYLALFPMAFFWFRRAWRIVVKRDFSEVALKRGVPPPNAEKFAPFEMIINLIAGTVATVVIVSVALGQLDYNTWTAIAGSTMPKVLVTIAPLQPVADALLAGITHSSVLARPGQDMHHMVLSPSQSQATWGVMAAKRLSVRS